MLSIRTDLLNLIVQNSMGSATNKLNQAIERMTTGAKLNHAKDNAANYSIATDMLTKISAYDVAADNTAMGMDMIATAEGNLAEIENRLSRLRALQTQVSNGSYGSKSLIAINTEVNALVDEIIRIHETSEYNGKKVLNTNVLPDIPSGIGASVPQNGGLYNKFIAAPVYYTDDEIKDTMTAISSVSESQTITTGEYYISTDEDLAKLARMTNNDKIQGGDFILANDIDLAEYCSNHIGEGGWTPIGTGGKVFKANFIGNGHVISNLKIKLNEGDSVGIALFGTVEGWIDSLGMENVDIQGYHAASLVYEFNDGGIYNCYSTGKISVIGNGSTVGGLINYAMGDIEICNSWSSVNIDYKSTASFPSVIGGLLSESSSCRIDTCYYTGNISGTGAASVGGIVAWLYGGEVYNSYSSADLIAKDNGGAAGIVAWGSDFDIINCHATGNIIGTSAGGLGGGIEANISNSYSSCYIEGESCSGGLIDWLYAGEVINSYSYSEVTGEKNVGGLIGGTDCDGMSSSNVLIKDCYSYSQISGGINIGAVVGCCEPYYNLALNIENTHVRDDGNGAVGVYLDTYLPGTSCDLTTYEAGIVRITLPEVLTKLQIGVYADSNSQININTGINISKINKLRSIGKNGECFELIDKMLQEISAKQTELGSVSNRLESVLDEILIQHDNLVSSRSTIRDADIAEVSSQYIQQQILQQASATLLSTSKNIQYQNVLGLLQSLR